jgi:hypothetical protein
MPVDILSQESEVDIDENGISARVSLFGFNDDIPIAENFSVQYSTRTLNMKLSTPFCMVLYIL